MQKKEPQAALKSLTGRRRVESLLLFLLNPNFGYLSNNL